MLNLEIPADSLPADAAVFIQDGEFVAAGHREECEQKAIAIGGLYCWIVKGRPVIRFDFEREDSMSILALSPGTRIDNRDGQFLKLAAEFEELVVDGTLDQEQNVAAELLAELMTPEQAAWEQAYREKYGEPFTGTEREAIGPAGKLFLVDHANQVIVVTTPQAWAEKQIKRIEQAMANDDMANEDE